MTDVDQTKVLQDGKESHGYITWPTLIWEIQDIKTQAIKAARRAEQDYLTPDGQHKRVNNRYLFPDTQCDRLRWYGPGAGVRDRL
jgi:hypothetical protein